MKQEIEKNNIVRLVDHFLFLVFFIALLFSFRAISSISIALIFLMGIIFNRNLWSSLWQRKPVNFFLAACVLFFLLQVISILYTSNHDEGLDQARLKSGVAITPLAIFCSGYINKETGKKLLFHFCLILFIASVYCVAMVSQDYLRSGEIAVFFYHRLVSPLHHHAVFYSIFVFIALVFLLESTKQEKFVTGKTWYILLIIYFSVFLFFLSSKLVIIAYITWLIIYFIRSFRQGRMQKIMSLGVLAFFLLAGTLALTTENSVSKRFAEIIRGDMGLFKQDQYNPGVYFNGLQYRLLQWKLVPEILNKNNAWALGVSPGDAQEYLDQEYVSKNMYTGDIEKKDRGFLGSNPHNQFLQLLLQNGLVGLLIFITICISMIKMAWNTRQTGTIYIILLLIFYAFIESVFETQYGIIIFSFFPVLLCLDKNEAHESK